MRPVILIQNTSPEPQYTIAKTSPWTKEYTEIKEKKQSRASTPTKTKEIAEGGRVVETEVYGMLQDAYSTQAVDEALLILFSLVSGVSIKE